MPAYIQTKLYAALVLLTLSDTAHCQLVCKPVEIGKDAIFVYDCPQQDGIAVDWKFGDDPRNYPCDSNFSSSQDVLPKLEVIYDGRLRKSTLRVYNIGAADDKKTVQCAAKGSEILQSCRLEAYYKPATPVCSVMQIKQFAVRFRCATPKVYPDLECIASYFENNSKKHVEVENKIWSTTKAASPGGLFSCSCSVDIEDLAPGSYDFFGVVKPVLSTKVPNSSVPSKVTDILNITYPIGKINVRQVTATSVVCSETEPLVEFLCEATDFHRMPELVWLVGLSLTNERFSPPVYKNGTVYFSRLSLRVTTKYRDAHIHCAESKFEYLVAGQQLLLVTWLKPTNLTTNFDPGIDNPRIISFPAHQNVSFSCGLAHDDHYVNNIRVHCYHETHTLALKESSGGDASAVLNVGAEYPYVNCECSARHKLNCTVKTKKVTINVDPTPVTLRSKTEAAGFGEDHFLILLGCACLVFFLLILYIVVTAVKKRCRRRPTQPDHYEDVKGVVSEIRRHAAPAWPYAVSEVQRLTAMHEAAQGVTTCDQLYVNIAHDPNSQHYMRARDRWERNDNMR